MHDADKIQEIEQARAEIRRLRGDVASGPEGRRGPFAAMPRRVGDDADVFVRCFWGGYHAWSEYFGASELAALRRARKDAGR